MLSASCVYLNFHGLYIINSEGIAYHHGVAVYGINPKVKYTLRVMPYHRKATDAIRRTRAAIPYQSFGLEEKSRSHALLLFS